MNIGIYGYGNLGHGVLLAAHAADDLHVVGVFTRRDPATVHVPFDIPVYPAAEILAYRDRIDVLILCGGSATDLPETTPSLARHFHVVDSFDTHAAIPAHFAAVDAAAKDTGHIGLISAGWDPGLFSVARAYASAVLPKGEAYTFWGRGVSQGHSDAIRRIEGVKDARQYTVPKEEALAAVRRGECPHLTTADKHLRECYVVAEDGADRERITRQIQTMKHYFADYETTVTFLTEEELQRDHRGLPHGGSVIYNGTSGACDEHRHTVEFRLVLDSNPEFTGSVLVAYARAVVRMAARGRTGAVTVLDVAPADLSAASAEDLRAHLL